MKGPLYPQQGMIQSPSLHSYHHLRELMRVATWEDQTLFWNVLCPQFDAPVATHCAQRWGPRMTDVVTQFRVGTESSMQDRHKHNTMSSTISGRVCTECRSSGVCQRLPGRGGDCLSSFSKKYKFAVDTGVMAFQTEHSKLRDE